MLDAGLVFRAGEPLIDTDQTVRCAVRDDKERRGWYRLSTIEIDGTPHLVGAYGIWRGNDNGKVAVHPSKGVVMTREQREAITARIAADTRRAKALRTARAERAALEAAKVWRHYLPTGTNSYLERKGVGAAGVRFHPTSDTLAIPMTDPAGKIWGLQLIRGADRGERLEKQYWPAGLDKVGHYHLLGGAPRDLLLIAEGYATAWSLTHATGLPCAAAFDAGNLLHVAKALRKHYPRPRILICADDDYRTVGNPGIASATSAALAVDGRWIAPVFAEERPVTGPKGATDFNDLAEREGAAAVRAQIEGFLLGVGWSSPDASPRQPPNPGEGGTPMVARLTIDDAASRYWGTYGMGGKALFDAVDRRIVHKDDVVNLLPRHGWEDLRDHPHWRVARDTEIGFDPTEADARIRCNLYAGWPTVPKAGGCERLLELLEYLCSGEASADGLYNWVLDWLALPLQRPGAKLHSAIVVHGPQGTGKSLFFETYCKIFGEYGRILGQEALEDKFNADWAEKKLFILADEILAKADLFSVKNRLKSFITGATIRVNPKNVAAHNEANHMNIVFLSNERQPLVLENDDRRHCVIWVPPKLPDHIFDEITTEIDNGGVAALHHFLLQRDLTHFHVASRPPDTLAKQELVVQSTSSEERFIQEWTAAEVEASDGVIAPVCPCLGTDLYRLYRHWCEQRGERARRMQDLIGHIGKLHGWRAGKTVSTWHHFQDKTVHKRKLVIPSATALERTIAADPAQERYRESAYGTQAEWFTHGYFAFADAVKPDSAR
jgi:putative DNA primase/helicase